MTIGAKNEYIVIVLTLQEVYIVIHLLLWMTIAILLSET